MPVKFECTKCHKRFVDWGAEKLGYQCPDCEDQELVRVGAADEPEKAAPPSLKRAKVKASAPTEEVIEPAAAEAEAVTVPLTDDNDDDDSVDGDDESGGLMSDGDTIDDEDSLEDSPAISFDDD